MAREDTMGFASYRVAWRALGKSHQTGSHDTAENARAAYEKAAAYTHIDAAMLMCRPARANRFTPIEVLA